MKRIIFHWTGGGHKASALDKKHYHKIFEGDGTLVMGNHSIASNVKPVRGKYAAHTLRLNTGSIGVSCAAMAGATSVNRVGKYPITKEQFEAMCKDAADDCRRYGIPVTDKTTLTHSEVQPNLGVKQRGKWDIDVLPHVGLKGTKACGDYLRSRIRFYLEAKPLNSADGRVRYLQNLLRMQGKDIIADGRYGELTKEAMKSFERDNELVENGGFGADNAFNISILRDLSEKKVPSKVVTKHEIVEVPDIRHKRMVDGLACEDRVSTTNVAALLSTGGGVAGIGTQVNSAIQSAQSTVDAAKNAGPWILLGLVIVGGGWWIWKERKRRMNEAREIL